MIYQAANKKIDFLKKLSEEQKIMFIYRYASLAITSLFFILSPINHTIYRKLFIITCISLSSIILNYLYFKRHNDNSIIKLLIFIETIGNSVILIPSGGLNSPYVWYALNTIFIAAIMLDRKYCLINLAVYIFASIWTSYSMFNEKNDTFLNIIREQKNLIISFLLIVVAIWLLIQYAKDIKLERSKLINTNGQLILANQQVKASVNHILELYQAVHLFSNLKSRNELIELILEYTKRIMDTDTVLFCNNENRESLVSPPNTECDRIIQQLRAEVCKQWNNIVSTSTAMQLIIEGRYFLIISVKSNYMIYGVLAAEVKSKSSGLSRIESMDQLKFIADLSSITLEKFELEKVKDKLIITEEQNRIANEIHDSVLQRLFSTSFGVYGLMKKLNKSNIQFADTDLNLIRESIDTAMKELRAAIYGLSWKKNGADNFITDLMKYIDEIKKMSNVDINLNINGQSEMLGSMLKKSIYRIICEGIGNANRHGKAQNIKVDLTIESDAVQLRIADDGIGFNIDEVYKNKQGGLGINNIHVLVNSHRGNISYQSAIGKGTIIDINIPNCASETWGDKVV